MTHITLQAMLHIYLILVLQMIYERLAKMKRLDEEMRNNPDKGKKMNAIALELGLYSSRFDGTYVIHKVVFLADHSPHSRRQYIQWLLQCTPGSH